MSFYHVRYYFNLGSFVKFRIWDYFYTDGNSLTEDMSNMLFLLDEDLLNEGG